MSGGLCGGFACPDSLGRHRCSKMDIGDDCKLAKKTAKYSSGLT